MGSESFNKEGCSAICVSQNASAAAEVVIGSQGEVSQRASDSPKRLVSSAIVNKLLDELEARKSNREFANDLVL